MIIISFYIRARFSQTKNMTTDKVFSNLLKDLIDFELLSYYVPGVPYLLTQGFPTPSCIISSKTKVGSNSGAHFRETFIFFKSPVIR